MSEFGYDKSRFPNLQGEMFDCIICSCVVSNPKECSGCGNLFCAKCIDSWKLKNATCPNRCNGSISPMTSKALLNIYNDLDIKCSKGCQKIIKLYDLPKHELNCSKVRCFNHPVCEGIQNKQFGPEICSERCQLLKTIQTTQKNPKRIYQILSKFKPKEVVVHHSSSTGSIGHGSSPNKNDPMKWNTNSSFCGQGVAFENQGSLVILKEAAYVFRTAIGSHGFTSGCHYWEIMGDQRTENELKIGVSTSNSFDFNTAFCDHIFGFAFYGLGQLRHNSNASGPQYGKKFKKQGVLGIYLNMDKGTLCFSLNGESMGEAYNDPLLKKGPIYPAVSLLHSAACTIKGELPIPNCFKDK